MEIVSAITMLSIVLTGAALMREREHGTVEHLLVLLPMQILSGAGGIIRAQALSAGGLRAREGMSSVIDVVMQAAPTTHFVELSQAILFRGAGLDAVSLARFRKTLGAMA